MPAYNEEGSLPKVLDAWYPVVSSNASNRLVVLNDGSKDRTMDILNQYAQDHPQLIAINKSNSGHGATIYDGYAYALANGARFIFQTDSDGQTDPEDFKKLWDIMVNPKEGRQVDAVLGVRSTREDGVSRVFVTNVLRYVVNTTMHASVPDANVPFRLMRNEALADALQYVPEHHNLTNVLLSAALCRLGKTIEYVPISFGKRSAGKNSINLRSIFHIGWNALSDFKRIDSLFPSSD